MPIYKVNGDLYDIPASKQDAFEKKYPEATVSYLQGSNEYAIPIAKRDAFLAKYPDAKPKSYSEIADTTTHSLNLDPLSADTQMEKTPIRGYWANLKEGAKELAAGAKYLAGEGVNMVVGSNRDELATLNEVRNIEAQGGNPTDIFAQRENQEFMDNYGMDKESFLALSEEDRKKLINEATSRNAKVIMPDEVDNVTEAYKKEARIRELYSSAIEEANGNLEKAKQILAKKAAEDKSLGDRMIESAEEDFAEIRPSEGFAGYLGRLTTQMIPNAAAITLAALSRGKSAKASSWLMGLSKATGTLGMATLTASSGGYALKEARDKGATNAEAAAATLTAMGIEAITEMIPYDTYTKGIYNSIKTKVRKDLQREVLQDASSAGRREFQKLLEEANKKLGGKLFSGKSFTSWLGQTATEGVSEFLAEGLGVMVPMIYEDPKEYPTLSEILRSGWEGAKAGLLMGAFLGGASQATFHSLNKDRRKQQGYVNIAQVDFGNGDVDVAEIVGKNEETGKYVVVRGSETEEVNRDQIIFNKHFTYNEFESARYKQLTDEAIDNGNVSDAQVAVAADKVGNARQRLENAMTAAGYSDEQKDAAYKTLEKGAYPEAYENIAEDVAKAMDAYMDAISREREVKGAKIEREQKEKDAIQASLERELGGRFWREEVTPISEEVEEVKQTVEIGQLKDGRLVYILSAPSATGERSAITDKGEQLIISVDMLESITEVMSLDQFLTRKVQEQKQAGEQTRMAAEAAPQLDEIRAKAQPGVQVNLGTEDSPIMGTILQIKPEGDGVLIQTESGVQPYTYEQLGDIFGTPVRTLTDAQMAAAEAAEIEAADAALETERAETSEQMDEAEEVADNAVQMEQAATETPLPTNPDGSVNEDALFAEDPARWAEWNDSERNDNGENSKAYIQGKIDRANAKIAELKKAYENEDSLNKKKELEKQIAALQETVDKLSSVMQKYAPQEDAVLALDEEVKAKMTAEKMQMIQQRAAEWEKKLGLKVNILTSLDDVKSEAAREEILQSDEIRKKGGYARTRGWFDKDSGQVYLYAPHIALLRPTAIEEDVDTTIFHEAVGHKGVRELLGEEKFNELLDRVWKEEMSPEDRVKYLVYTGGKGGTRAAADEFLAHRSEGMQYDSLWERVANWFKELLNIKTDLDTASVKDILRESYKNFAENGSTATYKGGAGDNIAKSVVSEEISALSQDLTMEEIKAVTANDLTIAKEAYDTLVANAPSVQPGETSVAYIERKKKYNEQLNAAKEDLDKKQAIVDAVALMENPEQTKELEYQLSDEVDENGRQFVLSEDGELAFGEISTETGLTPAPILLSEGIITNPKTNDGYGLVHIEARHGDQIRKEGYPSVLAFIKDVAQNYENIREGNDRAGNKTYMLQLTDKHNNTLMVELSGDGTYWNINTAGVFKTTYGANRKVVYTRHTTNNQSVETDEASQVTEQSDTQATSSMNAPTATSESKDNEIVESATESSKKDAVEALNENGFEVNTKTDDIMLSRRYLPTEEQRELIISSVEKVTGLSREQAEKWLASETSLAAIVGDDSQYLDYIPDDRYKAIKDNSDYPQGTVDFNNICRKRVSFTKMFTRLQRRFPNRIFTADDLADIRTIMSNDGLTVACGLCYVEDRRQMVGEVAAFFIDQMQKDFVDYTYEVSAKDFVAGKAKRKKSQSKDKVNKAAKYKILIGNDTYVPKIYDLTTLEGLDKLYNEHRGIWEAFQAFNSDRGQQSQNLFQGYAEYKREILSWSDAKVKKVNSLGGLRVFSYSDFEAHHLLDLVQIIIDCAARGVMIQGYTKVPEFARAVAKTGIKLNRSLIPLGDTGIVDGQLAFDPIEGIDVNDPNFLESNDNVGNILIGINDEQIRLAMASPFIHYIIPYHARQAEGIRMKLKVGKWDNYIDTQNERNISDGKRVKKGINIYTDVLSEAITNDREFVEKYLEVCREKGYIPKFDQFLNKDAEGNYVYTPGYHKFLVDFKLFDENGNILPQKPVVAQFDDAFNAEILQKYVADEKETTGAQMNETYKKIVDALNLNEEEAEGENLMFSVSMESLDKASDRIRDWMNKGLRGKSFELPLPQSTLNRIKNVMGRDFDSHNITANGVAHALNSHGVNGRNLQEGSIPITIEHVGLIPYIMTAPDRIEKGSTDPSGRESIRFYKNLSNGYVVVIEKEYKNNPDDMETINMWAEMSSKATNAQQNAAPGINVRTAILSTDMAKIRKDAEDAITFEEKLKDPTLNEKNTLFSTRTDEDRAKLFDTAKKKYGVTNNFNASGYMLPDGSLLDFSEANDGGDPNRRSLDHRDIEGIIMDEGREYDSRYKYIVDFMNEGAIRMMPESDGVNLSVAPSAEQRSKLIDYFYKKNGYIILEIANENGGSAAYVEYDKGTSPYRIMKDIDGYFNEGIAPQQNVMFSTSNRNQEIFVSNAAKAVEGIKMEKATPEQWLKMIEKNGGLKAGEDKWMGLSDWLKASDKKTLTKDEVLAFINEHMIQIEEVHYGQIDYRALEEEIHRSAVNGLSLEELQQMVDEEKKNVGEFADSALLDYMIDEFGDDFDLLYDIYDGRVRYRDLDYVELEEYAQNLGEENGVRPIDDDRLLHTTKGLTNNHEIALTVPTIESWKEDDELHFGDAGEGRAVAWIRFGETWEQRPSPQISRKVLVIDEIQSNRHQKGREKGYVSSYDTSEKLEDLNAALDKKVERRGELIRDKVANEENEQTMLARIGIALEEVANIRDYDAYTKERDELVAHIENRDAEIQTLTSEIAEIEEEIKREERYLEYKKSQAVEDAPFEKNWHEVAMKRMLRYAAENGYGAVAWTKGEQQNKRYGLSKHVTNIESEFADKKSTEGSIRIYFTNGDNHHVGVDKATGLVTFYNENTSAIGKPLSDLLGKELADKILNHPLKFGSFSGLDLELSEGMKGFYDKMLPAFMNKYGKKWGIKVEDINLPNLEEAGRVMHSVPVTEEMKQSVMEGQLMFSTKGADESAKDFIQNATDAFYSRYNTVAPAAVVYANSRKMVAEGLGIDVDNLTDEVYKFIREKAKRSGGLFLPMQFTKEDGTVEERYRILIFAKDAVNMTAKADRILFHENTHGLISEMPELLDLGQWLLGSDERITSGIAADVKAQYDEDDWAEEMACDYVGVMLSLGRGQEALNNVADEYKPLLNSVYERFGYNPEDEDPRRRSERNKDARELQMRNTESEANSNQREEKLFSTVITPEVRREMDVISAQAIVNGNYLKAPNGKDTKLTPEQWSLVRTQNFKKWFGDWENDPENASKVVDENGEPMVVYHGTAGVINTFEDQQRSPGFWFVDREDVANGYAESAAGEFGEEKNIIPVFLNMRNPRIEDAFGQYPSEFTLKAYVENDNGVYEVFDTLAEAEAYREANVPDGWVGSAEVGDQHDLVERAKELGYDGVIMLNMHDQAAYAETRVEGTQTNYVVLNDNQIKSATENNGEYSENEDIRFSTVSTPTEVVVENGLALSPKDVTNLAANIFKSLPENVRKEIVDRASQDDWDLQKATLNFVNEMALAYNLSDEHVEAVLAIAQKVEDAIIASGETLSRPLTTNEALWMLYNALNPANESNPFAMAERYVVADNLGFSDRAKAEDDRLESEIMFSTTRRASDNARANLYNRGAASAMSRLKESFVDMYASVEELVKAIEVATGKPAKGFENILKALNQQSSKGLAAMKDYEARFLEPMFEEIVRIMSQAHVSYDDVVRYVILKHGLERNDKFAKRDAREYWQSVYNRVAEKMKNQSHASLVVALSEAKTKVTALETEIAVASGAKLRKLQDQLDAAKLEVTVNELALRNNEQENEQELKAHLDDVEAGIDAKYKEFREKDYSGISSMFYDTLGVNREDYVTEEAYQAAVIKAKQNRWDTLAEVEGEAMHEVEMFERNADTKRLWKAINAATKETLRQQYDANVISKEQFDSLNNMFEFYVPLRGFKDNTAEDMYTYYRKPNSTGYTKPILGAEGRTTEAESPFGWIAAMASSAIASNVKNEAKLALYYFIVNRPENGIATVSKTWYVKTIENGKEVYKPSYPPFDADLSVEEAKEAYEQWQEEMQELRDKGLAYESGAKLNLGDSVVNISDVNKPEHVVTVKVGGKDYTIIINGNPRAAQAINGELNLETTGDYSKVFGPVLRWMSAVNTSYNPEFWITNTMRDMLFTWMSVSTVNDPEYRKAFKRNYRKAFKVLSLNKQYEKGTLGDSYIETMYKEFIKNGGVTGYTQIKDNATWEKQINKYLKSKDKEVQGKGKAMQKIKDGLHAMHRVGESLEQVSRFAAFLASREVGMSTIDSINNAKEITVNFNRKGSGKWISLEEAKHLTKKNGQPLSWFEQICVCGLSSIAPLGRRAIMFFNASIQGLNAYYKLFKNNPAKMTTWALGYAIIGILNAALHSLLDDDDDYMDMPEYERRTSLMLGGNGVYFKWALPQEARAFYALGDLSVESIMGRNPSEGVLDVVGESLNIALDVAPLNPTEGWKAFVPSVAVPLVELLANEDYKGAPIYNEQPWLSREEKKRTPKYTGAFKGTGKIYVYLSKALNDISDSWDVDEAGWLNVAPESIEHLVESAFGGTIRTGDKILKSVWNMFDPEEDVTVRNFPFLNRIVTLNKERNVNANTNEVFNDCFGVIEEIDTRMKRYEKEHNVKGLNELKKSEEYQWLRIYENSYKKRLDDLKKRIKLARTEEERRELLKKRDQLRKDFINRISNN